MQYRHNENTDSLAKDSMAVSRNDLTTLKGVPDVFLNNFVGRSLAGLFDHTLEPNEDFLVGETVEGAGETI